MIVISVFHLVYSNCLKCKNLLLGGTHPHRSCCPITSSPLHILLWLYPTSKGGGYYTVATKNFTISFSYLLNTWLQKHHVYQREKWGGTATNTTSSSTDKTRSLAALSSCPFKQIAEGIFKGKTAACIWICRFPISHSQKKRISTE